MELEGYDVVGLETVNVRVKTKMVTVSLTMNDRGTADPRIRRAVDELVNHALDLSGTAYETSTIKVRKFTRLA